MRHAALYTTSTLLLAVPSLAFGQEADEIYRSLDTQLVGPALMPGAAIAIDSPRAWRPLTFQGGAAWQLERMPLEYFENGESVGAAITTRNTLHVAGGTTVYKGITAYGRWAAVIMDPGVEGAENAYPESNLALGDLAIGVKADLIQANNLAFGPHLDVWFPTGTKDSWVAEEKTRYMPGLLLDLDTGPVEIFSRLGLLIRSESNSNADFILGSEVPVGLGVAVPFSDRVAALAEATGRMSFVEFLKPGAENPFEAKAGVRWKIGGVAQVDLAAGTALDNGYGTSDIRALLSVVNIPRPAAAPTAAEVVEVEAPKPKAAEVIVPDQKEEIQWEEGVLAQVHRGHIVIKDPIQFEFATANILPVSQPTLDAVARVMNDYPQIEHLLIEGHASEEGTYEYNYKLSSSRANAIYESLIRGGVRPERLSYRGMGETVPVALGTDEESLALNRRVEFKIMKVRDFLDVANQDTGEAIVSPMTGEEISAPKMGEKQLSADANPILVEVQTAPKPEETSPDAAEFRTALEEAEELTPEEETAPPTETAPPENPEAPPENPEAPPENPEE
ncbi:MAG: OmpA family protein [Deltaproteobacteria bacterium]|nr:OmpA family protein [Deltaproteobacteria bacterium]